MPDNKKDRPVHVAVKGIVISAGRALILCRNDALGKDGRPWWEFPGGTLEFPEEPEQTLVREFREETNLVVTPVRLLYVSSAVIDEKYEIVIVTYLVECDDVNGVRISKEHRGYLWADEPAMREYLADDIARALDKNGVWKILEQEW